MGLKILLSIFCLLFASGTLCAKTRAQVASDASSMITITPAWTATNNSHSFTSTITFTSNFLTGVMYPSWPYVYGGKEDAATTTSRITSGTSPGGVNTKSAFWTTESLYYAHYNPARYLAGIDCSGFACRALGYTSNIGYTNTRVLSNLSVGISTPNIQPGDLLIDIDTHVRVIVSTNPLSIAEAVGGKIGKARIDWNAKIGDYGVYSPFPVFSDFNPSSGTVVTSSHPAISFMINSGTGISASTGVVTTLDGNVVQADMTHTEGTKDYGMTYTPEVGLADGRHVLHVWAGNSMGLEEEAENVFHVSETEHIEFGLKDSSGNDLSTVPMNIGYNIWAYAYAGIEISDCVL